MKVNQKAFEAKATKQFSKFGKEPITAEAIGGAIYGFGSELATLRCFKVYNKVPSVRHGYSANLGWFFSYDISIEFENNT